MSEYIRIDFNGYSREVIVPDSVVALIHDAFASEYGRPDVVVVGKEEVPNPQSKQSFTAERIRLYIEQVVAGYSKKQAAVSAVEQAEASVAALLGSITVDSDPDVPVEAVDTVDPA
jgi:hypothetical protein